MIIHLNALLGGCSAFVETRCRASNRDAAGLTTKTQGHEETLQTEHRLSSYIHDLNEI
jgi:hypothetical protein